MRLASEVQVGHGAHQVPPCRFPYLLVLELEVRVPGRDLCVVGKECPFFLVEVARPGFDGLLLVSGGVDHAAKIVVQAAKFT